MNDQIIKFAEKQWDIHFKKLGIKPKRLDYVQLSQSHTKDFKKSRVVLLIFADKKTKPILVAKFVKDKSYEKNLKTESLNSSKLNKISGHKILPEVYAEGYIDGRLVVFEEFIDGASLDTYIREQVDLGKDIKLITKEVFGSVKGLLEKVNTGRKSVPDRSKVKDELVQLISQLGKKRNLDKSQYEKFLSSASIVANSRSKIYRGIINFDFVAGNLIKSGSKYRVIDFEFSAESNLSFIELVRFLYFYIELLTELGAFGTYDFALNLGYMSYNPKHWLYKEIKLSFSEFLDIHLLSEYFMVGLVQEAVIQLDVDHDSRHGGIFFDNVFQSLNKLISYIFELIKQKDADVKYLQHQLQWKIEEQSREQRELEALRSQIADINSSRLWKLLNKIRNLKNKILR